MSQYYLTNINGAAIIQALWIIVSHKMNNFVVFHVYKMVFSKYMTYKIQCNEITNNNNKFSMYMFTGLIKKHFLQFSEKKKKKRGWKSNSSNIRTTLLIYCSYILCNINWLLKDIRTPYFICSFVMAQENASLWSRFHTAI